MPASAGASPEHYYLAVEATDDHELWEDAKWFAFDKEYWGTPEREARMEEINGLLIACAGENWDSAIRGCLINLYETELTAEERLNICYWGDAVAAAWVDDPPAAPGEPSTPIPGPVAGWADPVAISHDGRPDREHGWWVVNIPAPLCCKSSWYMVVRDKAANWRRAEPVDLPPQLVPSVTVDPQTGAATLRGWGYTYSASPPESGGYVQTTEDNPDNWWLEVSGRTFGQDETKQYINLPRDPDVGDPVDPPATWSLLGTAWPDTRQRDRMIEIEVISNAPALNVVVLDSPYDPPEGIQHTSDCITSRFKDVSDATWRADNGDNGVERLCYDRSNFEPKLPRNYLDNYDAAIAALQLALEADPACLYLQGDPPTTWDSATGCLSKTYSQSDAQGVPFWTETQSHRIRFRTSDYASDDYQIAVCACDMATLKVFAEDYYQRGPLPAGEYQDNTYLGTEVEMWRKVQISKTLMAGQPAIKPDLVESVFSTGNIEAVLVDAGSSPDEYWIYWLAGKRGLCETIKAPYYPSGPLGPGVSAYAHAEDKWFHSPGQGDPEGYINPRHSYHLLGLPAMARDLVAPVDPLIWPQGEPDVRAWGGMCDISPSSPDRHASVSTYFLANPEDPQIMGLRTLSWSCASMGVTTCVQPATFRLRVPVHEVGHALGHGSVFYGGTPLGIGVDQASSNIMGVDPAFQGDCITLSLMERTCLFAAVGPEQFNEFQVVFALRAQSKEEEYPTYP